MPNLGSFCGSPGALSWRFVVRAASARAAVCSVRGQRTCPDWVVGREFPFNHPISWGCDPEGHFRRDSLRLRPSVAKSSSGQTSTRIAEPADHAVRLRAAAKVASSTGD
jgi:hypothetical protein